MIRFLLAIIRYPLGPDWKNGRASFPALVNQAALRRLGRSGFDPGRNQQEGK